MKCEKCFHEISYVRMASCWPTYISCKQCKAKYTSDHGNITGAIYLAMLVPALLLPFIVSSFLGVEDHGIYRKPAIAPAITLLGPVLIYFTMANVFGWLLVTRFNLKRKKNSI